jgi:hypothetical protein
MGPYVGAIGRDKAQEFDRSERFGSSLSEPSMA